MVSGKSVRVIVPPDLHARAQTLSEKTGVSLSHVVRTALSVWAGQQSPDDFEQLVAAAALANGQARPLVKKAA